MWIFTSLNQMVIQKIANNKNVVNQRKKLLCGCLAHPRPRSSPPTWFMLTEVPTRKWGCVCCGMVGGAKRGLMSHIKG